MCARWAGLNISETVGLIEFSQMIVSYTEWCVNREDHSMLYISQKLRVKIIWPSYGWSSLLLLPGAPPDSLFRHAHLTPSYKWCHGSFVCIWHYNLLRSVFTSPGAEMMVAAKLCLEKGFMLQIDNHSKDSSPNKKSHMHLWVCCILR